MAKLNTDPNTAFPDELYQQFVNMHDGLSAEESLKINAKMVLLLANHIGDADVVGEAISIATSALNPQQMAE